MSELKNALARRRKEAETSAISSQPRASLADITSQDRTHGQFTPRGATAESITARASNESPRGDVEPKAKSAEPKPAAGRGKGKSRGRGAAANAASTEDPPPEASTEAAHESSAPAAAPAVSSRLAAAFGATPPPAQQTSGTSPPEGPKSTPAGRGKGRLKGRGAGTAASPKEPPPADQTAEASSSAEPKAASPRISSRLRQFGASPPAEEQPVNASPSTEPKQPAVLGRGKGRLKGRGASAADAAEPATGAPASTSEGVEEAAPADAAQQTGGKAKSKGRGRSAPGAIAEAADARAEAQEPPAPEAEPAAETETAQHAAASAPAGIPTEAAPPDVEDVSPGIEEPAVSAEAPSEPAVVTERRSLLVPNDTAAELLTAASPEQALEALSTPPSATQSKPVVPRLSLSDGAAASLAISIGRQYKPEDCAVASLSPRSGSLGRAMAEIKEVAAARAALDRGFPAGPDPVAESPPASGGLPAPVVESPPVGAGLPGPFAESPPVSGGGGGAALADASGDDTDDEDGGGMITSAATAGGGPPSSEHRRSRQVPLEVGSGGSGFDGHVDPHPRVSMAAQIQRQSVAAHGLSSSAAEVLPTAAPHWTAGEQPQAREDQPHCQEGETLQAPQNGTRKTTCVLPSSALSPNHSFVSAGGASIDGSCGATSSLPPASLTAHLPFVPSPSCGATASCSKSASSSAVGAGSSSGSRTSSESLIWRAVVEGDVAGIEELASRGLLTSGRMMDQNGHSIFWNAVAFQKFEVALWLLRRFPPGSPGNMGVNIAEVHSRRNDSLLHLSLYDNNFAGAAAETFRVIFDGGGNGACAPAPKELENHQGQTFVHIAATRLNFWVLRFVLKHSPEISALFIRCDKRGMSPLDLMVNRVREVVGAEVLSPPPAPPAPAVHMPPWAALARFTPTAAGTLLPFSDLQLEVEDNSQPDGIRRLHAHRVVLSASSGELHALIRKLPAGAPLRVDPLCCRDGEVMATALRFLYGSRASCSFVQDAFLLWQLLCVCVQYKLPEPLARYAKAALLHSLDNPRHAPVLPVLLQAADKVGLTALEGSFVACTLFSRREALQPAVTAGVPGGGQDATVRSRLVKLLLAGFRELERGVLEGSKPGASAATQSTTTSVPSSARHPGSNVHGSAPHLAQPAISTLHGSGAPPPVERMVSMPMPARTHVVERMASLPTVGRV